MKFSAQQTTTASKANVWRVWEDVGQWQLWDTELDLAEITSFTLNAVGTLRPKQGPQSQFTITELTDGESFTFRVKLPLARLDVAHYYVAGEQTTFVHEVEFGGAMGWLFGRILGSTYKKALPGVLQRIKRLAEA